MVICKEVNNILNIFNNNHFEAFLVGGSIRDLLLNAKPFDWDIATNATPQEVIKIFPHSIPTGIKHGTVTIIFNNLSYEVTTYRTEENYSNYRHPDSVIFVSSITEDLSRRDFTVNSMAYNEKNGLIDPYNGMKDLKLKILRCVGDPLMRFKEDALRMLRAIRFSCQLSFEIEENTLKAIYEHKTLIKNISNERMNDELCKILLSNSPTNGVNLLLSTGLMEFIIPELFILNDHEKLNSNTFDVLNRVPKIIEVRLAALLHQDILNQQNIENILQRLKFSNQIINTVKKLTNWKENQLNFKNKLYVKKFIISIGKQNIHLVLALMKAEGILISNLENSINIIFNTHEPLSLKDLAIDGHDLLNIGHMPGKEIGNTLNQLLNIVLEYPDKNNKDTLINLSKSIRN